MDCVQAGYSITRQSVIAIFFLYLWCARFFSACSLGLVYLRPYKAGPVYIYIYIYIYINTYRAWESLRFSMYNVSYVKTALKKIMNRTSPVQSHWFFISTWKQVCVMHGTAAKVRLKSYPWQDMGFRWWSLKIACIEKRKYSGFFFYSILFQVRESKRGRREACMTLQKIVIKYVVQIVILFIVLICTGLQRNALDCDITKWRVISWLLICRGNSPKIPFQICVTFLTRVEIN